MILATAACALLVAGTAMLVATLLDWLDAWMDKDGEPE